MAVDLTRANALATTNDLAEAGAVTNDLVRLSDGGLWATPADNNNQQNYLSMFNADAHAVQNDIASALANGAAIGGAAYTLTAQDTAVLNQVATQVQTLITTAPNAVGNHPAAQATLHNTETAILNEVNGDPALAAALHGAAYTANTGATDNPFQALVTPAAHDAASLAAATAQGATLAQIGTVFNDAANLAVGGLNNQNIGQFQHDFQAVATGLQNTVNSPAALAAIEAGQAPADAALTTVHLDTLLNEANLQINSFDKQINNHTTLTARGTNDNVLDMIDIVQNDPALAAAAGNATGTPNHTSGFGEQPGYLSGTIQHFQDNQGQTNFWSSFLAEANTINGQLQNVVANGVTPQAAQTLITQLQHYEQFGQSFSAQQGPIFQARFNNELTQGTLQADTTNAIHGLTGIAHGDTGAALAADQAQLLGAGAGFAADAMDVSGNNTPAGGASFVAAATTVATATVPGGLGQGTIPVTGPANGNTGLPISHTPSPVETVPDMSHTAMDFSHLWHHA